MSNTGCLDAARSDSAYGMGNSTKSAYLDKLEYAEVRGTRWEVRSIKSGRLRLQVFSIDNKWRAARLAELSLRTSHLVLG